MALLSLPEETLHAILKFTLPEKECQTWEWIGVLDSTCRLFCDIAQEFAATCFALMDYEEYQRLMFCEQSFDARKGILEALKSFSWMRQNLVEFHVNWKSILKNYGESPMTITPEWGNNHIAIYDSVRLLLCSILTTHASLPKLQWLDINVHSDHVFDYNLINAESLCHIPFALPSLQQQCLSGCFKAEDDDDDNYDAPREVSPYQLN